LAGRATVSAEVGGRTDAPAITGRAEVTGAAVAGRALESVDARFSLATAPRDGARSLSRWDGSIELARAAWQSIAAESIAATFSLGPQRFELPRARARVAAVPLEVTGAWPWAGGARAKVLVGPVALGSIAGVRTALDLAGTGRGQITVSTERGVVSTE